MSRPDSLSAAQARRLAISAQGLAASRPAGRVDRRHLHRVLGRIKLLQLDSVNVLARSHYLPLFARLGAYDRSLLDRAAYVHGELFEYWAHEASLLPIADEPLWRWRAEELASRWYGRMAELLENDYVEAVYQEVVERGPLTAGELSEPGGRPGQWWSWGTGKRALEWLFAVGRLSALRRGNFERVYDLIERVIPGPVRAQPTPSRDDAWRTLLLRAADALGVATAGDLVDYFRLPKPAGRAVVAELAVSGELEPVRVEGWRDPGYVLPDVHVPRRVRACALLSPFDSLVWERARAERLFGFHYRIEIYTPAPKRIHGYYVLPFLLGDSLVGRVDLKADRTAGVLRVPGAYVEERVRADDVVPALRQELELMARWLGLSGVDVTPRGALAEALCRS